MLQPTTQPFESDKLDVFSISDIFDESSEFYTWTKQTWTKKLSRIVSYTVRPPIFVKPRFVGSLKLMKMQQIGECTVAHQTFLFRILVWYNRSLADQNWGCPWKSTLWVFEFAPHIWRPFEDSIKFCDEEVELNFSTHLYNLNWYSLSIRKNYKNEIIFFSRRMIELLCPLIISTFSWGQKRCAYFLKCDYFGKMCLFWVYLL